jgi:hypothetical protein
VVDLLTISNSRKAIKAGVTIAWDSQVDDKLRRPTVLRSGFSRDRSDCQRNSNGTLKLYSLSPTVWCSAL